MEGLGSDIAGSTGSSLDAGDVLGLGYNFLVLDGQPRSCYATTTRRRGGATTTRRRPDDAMFTFHPAESSTVLAIQVLHQLMLSRKL